MLVQVATWFLWLMLYSFLGWVYESTLCSITAKRPVNRGFLNGPICPIYGSGALVIILCLGKEADGSILSLFLSGAVLTCTLEYITSWLMEKLFHARWWDYSEYRFQINGRVCLLGAVAFGAMSVVILKWVHPWVSSWTSKLPDTAVLLISGILLALLVCDIIVTVRSVLHLDQKLSEVQRALDRAWEKMREDLREEFSERRGRFHTRGQKILDHLEKSSQWNGSRFKELLNQKRFQERRLLRAYPRLQSVHREALDVLRARLEEWKRDKKSK